MATGGGLQRLIENLPVFAFRKTFATFQAGEGAAISVSLFMLLVVLTILYFWVFRREGEA
jgi:ABC-type sugar transport system permease subunit